MIANRRKLKELGLLEDKPRMTKDGPIDGYTTTLTYGGPVRTKFFNLRAYQAARKRRFSEPVANKILIPLAPPYSQTTAKGKGGSVLKRHSVDLGESSDNLAENLNFASDPSPTAGTEAEEKGGSVPNKDVGESSEIVVENLNPGADSSANNVASGVQAEVEGGSVHKRPAADRSATVGAKDGLEGGSVLKRACVNLGESSELVARNLNPIDPSAATSTVANMKEGYVLNKDLGESSEVVAKI